MAKEWNQQTTADAAISDPLANHRNVPILAEVGPDSRYVGRVIVELFDDDSSKPDSNKIAFSVGAVDGNKAVLIQRVADALVKRVQQTKPFTR